MKSSNTAFRSADAGILADWSALVASSGANPTLSPAWLGVAVDVLGKVGEDVSLRVLRDPAGEVRAIVPYFQTRGRMLGLPVQQFEIASNLMSYHAELLAPGIESLALDSLLLEDRDWEVMRICNVVKDSATANAVRAFGERMGCTILTLEGESSPYLRVGSSWNEYLATRNKKFRYKHRKRQESLSSSATCRLAWYSKESEATRLLEDMLAIERVSWKAAEGSDIGSREQEAEYHRLLLPVLARQGWLRGLVLYRGEQPIAYSLCCHAGTWFGHLKTSFDAAHADISPGAVVIDASVEEAFSVQASEFDFLGDAVQHKLAWTDTVRVHADYLLFARRPKARLIGALKTVRQRGRARITDITQL